MTAGAADPGVPPGVAPGVRVTALGTGSAVGRPPRGHASLLVEAGPVRMLVDAPGDAPQRILAAGVDPLDLDLMVLTHHHEDHWGGLPSLLVHRMVRQRTERGDAGPRRLRILAPPASVAFLERLLELLERRELVELEPFDEDEPPVGLSGGWTLQAAAGRHGSMPVSGVLLRRGGGPPVLAYSSDTEPRDAFLRRASGAACLVHECQEARDAPAGHTDAAGLLAALRARAADPTWAWPATVALVHLTAGPDDRGPTVLSTVRGGVPATTEVCVPDDGDVILET